MQTRHIDGIYRRDDERRYESRRRLVVAARPAPVVGPAPFPAVLPSTHSLNGLVMPDAIAPLPAHDAAPPTAAPVEPQDPDPQTEVAVTAPDRPAALPPRTRRSRVAAYGLIVASALVLLGTGALGYQTWQTNLRAQAASSEPQSASTEPSPGTSTASRGDAPPSEAAVSDEAKATHVVAPDLPRTVSIDRIGVHARVLRMGLTEGGAVDAPKGAWDTGWYDGSAKPGQGGNVFIDGHISGPTQPAVFAKLKVLHEGDFITIERGDGKKLTYKVSTVTTQKVPDIDMAKVLAGPGGEALTLMTCGGNYQGDYTYDSRVIVIAKPV